MSTLPEISHPEYQIMREKIVALLDELAKNPANPLARERYDKWLSYVSEQIIKRGLACQDCRLDRH